MSRSRTGQYFAGHLPSTLLNVKSTLCFWNPGPDLSVYWGWGRGERWTLSRIELNPSYETGQEEGWYLPLSDIFRHLCKSLEENKISTGINSATQDVWSFRGLLAAWVWGVLGPRGQVGREGPASNTDPQPPSIPDPTSPPHPSPPLPAKGLRLSLRESAWEMARML